MNTTNDELTPVDAMQLERRQFLMHCCAGLALGVIGRDNALAMSAPRIDYPEHGVREFLKIHFAGSRAFTPLGLDKKERWFTRRFRLGIYKFFDRLSKAKTSIPLVVDPFTGSQGANNYTVGDAKVRVEKAWIPVTFTDGSNTWTITYVMRNDQERNDDRWRIDDIQDRRGMLLSDVLKK